MLPEAHVVHCIEGRMRLRIPARRRDTAWFAGLDDRLRTLPGIDFVAVNALAASVLLLHQSRIEQIEQFARENELFRLVFTDPVTAPLSRRLTEGCSAIDTRLQALSGGSVDVAGLAMIGFTLLGSWQVLKGNALPAGLSLFWSVRDMMSRNRSSSR